MTTFEILSTFIKEFPYHYKAMRETDHGYWGVEINKFHVESVWEHTLMVLKQSEKYEEHIQYAALCHDIGKAYCWEDIPADDKKPNRRRFINHEAVSVFFAKEVLEKFGLEQPMIRRVLEIVAQHGDLYGYMDKGRIPQKFYQRISEKYSLDAWDDLEDFYICDHEGRFHEDKADPEIKNDFGRIWEIIYMREKAENTRVISGTITLLIGPPRSGKSTYADEHFGYDGITDRIPPTIISRDSLVEKHGVGDTYSEKWKSLDEDTQKEIDKELRQKFNEAVKLKEQIVIDMTSLSKKTRKKWLSDKRLQGYFKRAILFIESPQVLYDRNTEEKYIPEHVIFGMIKRFSWPQLDEFDKVDLYFKDK